MATITLKREDLIKMSALANRHNSTYFFINKTQGGAYVGVGGGHEVIIHYFNHMNPETCPDAIKLADADFGEEDRKQEFPIWKIHDLAKNPYVVKLGIIAGGLETIFYTTVKTVEYGKKSTR